MTRTSADAEWAAHITHLRRKQKARACYLERARRHLAALDACAVALGVTRLRVLELASAPVTPRTHAGADVARDVQRR